MSNDLFFDTETTGFPSGKIPLAHKAQPHLVQIGAVLVGRDSRVILDKLNVTIKPDGWEIPEYATAVHGITTEHALEVGIPEEEALEQLLSLQQNTRRIAHNYQFDRKIVSIAIARFNITARANWERTGENFCTLSAVRGLNRPAKLTEAYKAIVGGGFKAHDALEDATACMEIFHKLQDLKRI